VVDLGKLRHNLEILADVQERAGCKILLALKGFAMWSTFDLVGRYLHGVAASSPNEARLGREHMGKAVHTYAPAYSQESLQAVLPLSDHVVFNSMSQWLRFEPLARQSGVNCGLRVNPRHSEVEVALYDPCAPGSRLGATRDQIDADALDGITGLHFHTLCELGSDALERTLQAFEREFGDLLPRMAWVNMGGGHHITRDDYDRERLIRIVREFRERHDVEVFLEPGEAIALNTGVLVATVLDIVHNEVDIAILDASATAHMPDVLEMPYQPRIAGAGDPGQHRHAYRLGGQTCLAGDVIGDYSFTRPLQVGDRLVFEDMAHYTMVKNTTFNGVELPSIVTHDPETDEIRVVRRFGYEDYAGRLS
jgi:carboxynorspermidine decarboxylase